MELPFLRHFFPHLQAWKCWKCYKVQLKSEQTFFFQELKYFVFNPQQNWHVNWFFNKTIFPKNPNSFECRPKKLDRFVKTAYYVSRGKSWRHFFLRKFNYWKFWKFQLYICLFATLVPPSGASRFCKLHEWDLKTYCSLQSQNRISRKYSSSQKDPDLALFIHQVECLPNTNVRRPLFSNYLVIWRLSVNNSFERQINVSVGFFELIQHYKRQSWLFFAIR